MHPNHQLAKEKSKVCIPISQHNNMLKEEGKTGVWRNDSGRSISVENEMSMWHGAAGERTDGLKERENGPFTPLPRRSHQFIGDVG